MFTTSASILPSHEYRTQVPTTFSQHGMSNKASNLSPTGFRPWLRRLSRQSDSEPFGNINFRPNTGFCDVSAKRHLPSSW
jgi:hypothetical protein